MKLPTPHRPLDGMMYDDQEMYDYGRACAVAAINECIRILNRDHTTSKPATAALTRCAVAMQTLKDTI